MKILFVADVYGRPGRRAFASGLARARARGDVDFAIVNGENAAGGFGMTPDIARGLLENGAGVLTSGN
nr:YmdB family metallophosphoesterase [Gemmatimonadota bacterium]